MPNTVVSLAFPCLHHSSIAFRVQFVYYPCAIRKSNLVKTTSITRAVVPNRGKPDNVWNGPPTRHGDTSFMRANALRLRINWNPLSVSVVKCQRRDVYFNVRDACSLCSPCHLRASPPPLSIYDINSDGRTEKTDLWSPNVPTNNVHGRYNCFLLSRGGF